MNIFFLVGMPGVGKTTCGKRWAKQFQIDFIDLDTYIATKEGQTIAQIFESKGEAQFRILEHFYLKEIISKPLTSLIVACGGGTPCYRNNMTLMKANGTVIYLKKSIATVTQQILNDANNPRPLLLGYDTPDALHLYLESLYEKRILVYQQSDSIFDINDKIDGNFARLLNNHSKTK
jgi:shikimate kinase